MTLSWRRVAEPESIVLALTLLNCARIWYLIWRMSGIACIVCPWYVSWGFEYEPARLLAAALLLRTGWRGARVAAAFLAAQVGLAGLYLGLTPEELRALWAGGLTGWPFLTQGLLGAVVAGLAWLRLARDDRCARWLRWPTRVALGCLLVVVVGVASSLSSTRACEGHVATWVTRELLRGEPFAAWGGIRGWGDSASVFRRVGADVTEREDDLAGKRRTAMLGTWSPTLPFVLRVDYSVRESEDGSHERADGARRSGMQAFVCLFGFTRRLEQTEWLTAVDRAVMACVAPPWRWGRN